MTIGFFSFLSFTIFWIFLIKKMKSSWELINDMKVHEILVKIMINYLQKMFFVISSWESDHGYSSLVLTEVSCFMFVCLTQIDLMLIGTAILPGTFAVSLTLWVVKHYSI